MKFLQQCCKIIRNNISVGGGVAPADFLVILRLADYVVCPVQENLVQRLSYLNGNNSMLN